MRELATKKKMKIDRQLHAVLQNNLKQAFFELYDWVLGPNQEEKNKKLLK